MQSSILYSLYQKLQMAASFPMENQNKMNRKLNPIKNNNLIKFSHSEKATNEPEKER